MKHPPSSPGRAVRADASIWAPPSLQQAYSQAVRYATLPWLHTSAISVDSILKISARKKHEATKVASGISIRRSSRLLSSTSISKKDWTKKVFVLVTSGYLLQYAAAGSQDRLPERVLRLGLASAAFASDAIPGKHWVLQVSQSMLADGAPVVENSTFFSRLTSRNREQQTQYVLNMLLVLDSAEDLEAWLATMKRELEWLKGGRRHPVPYAPPIESERTPKLVLTDLTSDKMVDRVEERPSSFMSAVLSTFSVPSIRDDVSQRWSQITASQDALPEDISENETISTSLTSSNEQSLRRLRREASVHRRSYISQVSTITPRTSISAMSPTKTEFIESEHTMNIFPIIPTPRPNAFALSQRRSNQMLRVVAEATTTPPTQAAGSPRPDSISEKASIRSRLSCASIRSNIERRDSSDVYTPPTHSASTALAMKRKGILPGSPQRKIVECSISSQQNSPHQIGERRISVLPGLPDTSRTPDSQLRPQSMASKLGYYDRPRPESLLLPLTYEPPSPKVEATHSFDAHVMQMMASPSSLADLSTATSNDRSPNLSPPGTPRIAESETPLTRSIPDIPLTKAPFMNNERCRSPILGKTTYTMFPPPVRQPSRRLLKAPAGRFPVNVSNTTSSAPALRPTSPPPPRFRTHINLPINVDHTRQSTRSPILNKAPPNSTGNNIITNRIFPPSPALSFSPRTSPSMRHSAVIPHTVFPAPPPTPPTPLPPSRSFSQLDRIDHELNDTLDALLSLTAPPRHSQQSIYQPISRILQPHEEHPLQKPAYPFRAPLTPPTQSSLHFQPLQPLILPSMQTIKTLSPRGHTLASRRSEPLLSSFGSSDRTINGRVFGGGGGGGSNCAGRNVVGNDMGMGSGRAGGLHNRPLAPPPNYALPPLPGTPTSVQSEI